MEDKLVDFGRFEFLVWRYDAEREGSLMKERGLDTAAVVGHFNDGVPG